MKANELMIGDWLCIEDANTRAQYYCRVKKIGAQFIYFDCDEVDVDGLSYDCFFPIPLTPEILEKNGFAPYEEDRESFHDENCVFIKQSSGGYGVCIEKKLTISGLFHYVHELQHALRLCGIDKEITIE